jgi:hypothetical protein
MRTKHQRTVVISCKRERVAEPSSRCCRVWPALVSSLFFNLHIHLFAPLFTGFLGQGDKETFPMAFLALGMPYSVIPTLPSSVGLIDQYCSLLGCKPAVRSNTMAQVNSKGEIVFLHANMDKWFLAVEASFSERVRHWQVISPGPDGLVQAFEPLAKSLWGCALDSFWQTADSLPSYWQELVCAVCPSRSMS